MTTHQIIRVGQDDVHVFDDVVPTNEQQRIDSFCRMLPFTRIRYAYRDSAESEFRHDHQWVHPVSQDESPFLPIRQLHELAEEATAASLTPGRVHINCIQPGDPRHPHIDDTTGRVVVAVYFANAEWQNDWMGELTFFDDDGTAQVISPRPRRAIVFNGTLLHRGGVPVTGCPEVRYAIAHKFLREA